jgi:pimeloyl-ACP methyl ester carboxylesterase
MAEVGVNGVVLKYERSGDGPPVLFCHGERCDRREWVPQRDALKRDFHVIAVDLPGHGATGRSDRGTVSPATLTADIREFLREVVGGPAVVVGRGLGGRIAYQLAAQYNDFVRGLVVVNPMPPVVRARSQLRLAGYGVGLRIARYLGWQRLFALQRWVRRDAGDVTSEEEEVPGLGMSVCDYVVAAEAVLDDREYSKLVRGLYKEMTAVAPVRVPFGSIHLPTLAVVGERASRRVQNTANRLVEVVPESGELLTVAGAGRFPQLEKPSEVTERLRVFLDTHVHSEGGE